MTLIRLIDAADSSTFGGKAVALGIALRAGLPVPDGFALAWPTTEAIALGDDSALAELPTDQVYAARSSAVGEDSTAASFAGAHLSVLGVSDIAPVARAVTDIYHSRVAAGATAYRNRLGIDPTARMGVVIQQLVNADVAGVMFTRNPTTGAAECVVEASWGLGEAVVAGIVTPDRYVMDRRGQLIHATMGDKDIAIRHAGTGTAEFPVASHLINAPCLGKSELHALHLLALACDTAYRSTDHDIEFAFTAGALFLLQRRPITHPAGRGSPPKLEGELSPPNRP